MSERINFTDVYVDDKVVEAATEVLRSKRYVKGPVVEQFEDEFATFCDTDYAVGVSNGTAALLLSMKAVEVGPGDQVFVPAHTYFATVSPILELGAEPVFVDIDPHRYTIDSEELAGAVAQAENPTAIAVTHMHGQPAEMDEILEIANKYDLAVIEDSAQAHGAKYKGDRIGSFGDVACFSFYPSKNMTVGGDGGMVVTDNEEIARKVSQLRNHGRDKNGVHTTLGLNYRLDEVSGAIGIEQLSHLPDWNRSRNDIAQKYSSQLASIDQVKIPNEPDNVFHVYHHYPIQVPDRESFRTAMNKVGIDTGVHYDTAVHQHPAIEELVDTTTCIRAESLCENIVSLPMHPRLTDQEINRVCEAIKEYYK